MLCVLSHFSCVRFSATSWIVRLPCPQDSPGKNARVGCHALLQGIFLIQRSNPHLLHWQARSLPLIPWGKPIQNKTCVFLVAQWPSNLCNHMDCSPPGSSAHWDSPGKNTGVGYDALLQGIFPTQGSSPGLPHCRQILYHLRYQGSRIKHTRAQILLLMLSGCDILDLTDSISKAQFVRLLNKIASHNLWPCCRVIKRVKALLLLVSLHKSQLLQKSTNTSVLVESVPFFQDPPLLFNIFWNS